MSQAEPDHRHADTACAPYEPFAPCSSWPSRIEDDGIWESTRRELAVIRSGTSSGEWQQAFELILRAAAIDAVLIDEVASGRIDLSGDDAELAVAQAQVLQDEDHLVRATLEAKLRGYRRVIELTQANESVTEPWIRRLHADLCASQEHIRLPTESGSEDYPLNKGEY
jgi:hypothetical protein